MSISNEIAAMCADFSFGNAYYVNNKEEEIDDQVMGATWAD